MADGEVEANAEEFITMVAAGLTGATPHTISATINALSRLVFEFRGEYRSYCHPPPSVKLMSIDRVDIPSDPL